MMLSLDETESKHVRIIVIDLSKDNPWQEYGR